VIPALVLGQAVAIASSGAAPITLQPTFMAQLDFDAHAPEPATYDGFVLQRMRLGLRTSLGSWFTAVGSFEYADQKVSPFEVYVEATASKSWHFAVGFRRTPLFHTAKDELIESLPVEAWARVGNGSQSVEGNDGPNPAFDFRTDVVLGRAQPHRDTWWGLRFGVGGHAKNRVSTTGLSDTTPDGFLFYHPVPTNGWQVIGEAHLGAWLGPWTLTLEGGTATEQRSETTPTGTTITQPSIATRGAAFEVAYMAWGAPRRPGQSGVPGVWPNEAPWTGGQWRGGSIEVAARIERVDLEADAPDIRPGGAEGGAVAVDWWATPFVALTLAGYDYHYFLAPIEEPSETNFWLVIARTTVSFR
jgi:phosphate-selective porin OprO/OprP